MHFNNGIILAVGTDQAGQVGPTISTSTNTQTASTPFNMTGYTAATIYVQMAGGGFTFASNDFVQLQWFQDAAGLIALDTEYCYLNGFTGPTSFSLRFPVRGPYLSVGARNFSGQRMDMFLYGSTRSYVRRTDRLVAAYSSAALAAGNTTIVQIVPYAGPITIELSASNGAGIALALPALGGAATEPALYYCTSVWQNTGPQVATYQSAIPWQLSTFRLANLAGVAQFASVRILAIDF